jgi:hypothetical protein
VKKKRTKVCRNCSHRVAPKSGLTPTDQGFASARLRNWTDRRGRTRAWSREAIIPRRGRKSTRPTLRKPSEGWAPARARALNFGVDWLGDIILSGTFVAKITQSGGRVCQPPLDDCDSSYALYVSGSCLALKRRIKAVERDNRQPKRFEINATGYFRNRTSQKDVCSSPIDN